MPSPGLVITTDDLRAELSGSGMDSYFNALGDVAAQDAVLKRRILEGQKHLEHVLEMYFFQTRIVTRPVTPGLIRGTDYDVEEDGYPYTRADFATYGTIQLRKRPVTTITRAGIRYGNDQNYLAVMDYPNGWLNQQARLGILQVQAIVGGGNIGASGSLLLLPMIQTGFNRSATMPLIFSVSYTAGFLPVDFDPSTDDPSESSPDYNIYDLIRAVRFTAAANTLRAMSRSVGAGGGSIAMEELSQSWDSNRFENAIKGYEDEVKQVIDDFRSFDSPPMVFFA